MFSRIRRSIRGYRISFHNSSDSPSREEETMGGKLSTLMADAYISRAQGAGRPPLPVELPTTSPKLAPIPCCGDVPSPRSGHIALVDKSGNYMYVFGGYHDGRCFSDLYRLHLPSCTWKRIECTGDIPTPRVSHQGIVDGDCLMVFGGSNVPFGQSNTNDFYICDLRTHKWTLLPTTCALATDMPTPRYGHTMVKRRHELYVFAGTAGCIYYNDLYKLDLTTLVWKRILHRKAEGDHSAFGPPQPLIADGNGSGTVLQARHINSRPNPRYRHEAVATDEHMYIIGGGTPNPEPRPIDVYAYHFDSNVWRRCECKAAREESGVPVARRSHTCVLYDNRIYMFGGTDGANMFNDFWYLDLATMLWHRVDIGASSDRSTAAKCFHAACVTPGGCMYIFGGCADSNGTARSNAVSACYLTMPTLVELCSQVLGMARVFTPEEVHDIGLNDDIAELICDVRL